MPKNMLYLVRLEDVRTKSHGSDSVLAEFILSNRKEVLGMTISELAEATFTGYATVCRFFKRLGLGGFKEFKKIFSEEIKGNDEASFDLSVDFGEAMPYSEINRRICDYSASIVSNCGNLIGDEALKNAVKAIEKAAHIQFVGVGTSAVTAQYAYTKFFRVKPSCSFDSDVIITKMRTAKMDEKGLLFAISSSGRTKNIIETARIARKHGATVISICDFVDSPLAHLSDISICTTVRDSNKYIDLDFPLIQGQITLIDILYACVYNAISNDASKNFQLTHEAVNEDKLPGATSSVGASTASLQT